MVDQQEIVQDTKIWSRWQLVYTQNMTKKTSRIKFSVEFGYK